MDVFAELAAISRKQRELAAQLDCCLQQLDRMEMLIVEGRDLCRTRHTETRETIYESCGHLESQIGEIGSDKEVSQ